MDKETLSNYGWIVILVLILAVMIALATPFGSFIAQGFKATFGGFGNTNNAALEGVGLGQEPVESDEEHGNYIWYYQPYQGTIDGNTVEFVFHENGAYDVYNYTELQGYSADEGTAQYYMGKATFDEGEIVITNYGHNLRFPDFGNVELELKQTPIRPFIKGTPYSLSDNWGYTEQYIFEEDGSIEWKNNDGHSESWESNTATFGERYISTNLYGYNINVAIHPNGQTIIVDGYIYQNKCSHLNVEIRGASQTYTGDKYCADCGAFLEKGTALSGEIVDVIINSENKYDFGYVDGMANVVIPETYKHNNIEYRVVGIDEWAFAYDNEITSVSIPKTVKSIGTRAFADCNSLTTATFASNSSLTELGNEVFQGCDVLNNVTLPHSITKMGTAIFSSCVNLTNVQLPNGITHLPNNTFSNCQKLKSVTIPNNVTTLGDGVFINCTVLEQTGLREGITKIGTECYASCKALKTVTIPSTMKDISAQAFRNCSGITSVNLGKVKVIAGQAFSYCTSLSSVTIPAETEAIMGYVFNECSGLKSITFATNSRLTQIGENAFYNTRITTFTGPKTLRTIGDRAFYNCSALTKVDFEQDAQIQIFGSYCFIGCKNLVELHVPKTVKTLGFSSFDGVNVQKVYAESLDSWCRMKFQGHHCNPLRTARTLYVNGVAVTEIVIPSDITVVGPFQFDGCNAKKFVLHDGITVISAGAFNSTRGVTEITIPDSVTEIGSQAFEDSSVVTVNISENSKLTSIGAYAFYTSGYLKNIYIPSGVKTIGYYAFCATALTNVSFGDYSGWRIYKGTTVSGTGTAISVTDANDATYLKTTYRDYTWSKN